MTAPSTPYGGGGPETAPRVPFPPIRANLILFALTVVSVFHAGALWGPAGHDDQRSMFRQLLDPGFLATGAPFAVPLLAILLTHEFGHFIAARLHRVPASWPYFLPLPGLSFGTLGAVIAMRGAIRSRAALLDVGASGPIAGMLVALPALGWGLARSSVIENGEHWVQEGQSLLYLAMKLVFVGPIPHGHDVLLHPTAMAGWVGLFLTMINLLPWGQLDGGHIAYAVLGDRQHGFARWFRRGLLLLFVFNLVKFVGPVLLGRSEMPLSLAFGNSAFWLLWFAVLGIIARIAGAEEHPPYEPGELDPRRRIVGWACLVLFVLLFMPTPFAQY